MRVIRIIQNGKIRESLSTSAKLKRPCTCGLHRTVLKPSDSAERTIQRLTPKQLYPYLAELLPCKRAPSIPEVH